MNNKKNRKGREGGRFFRACYFLFSGIVKAIFRITVVYPQNEPDEGGFIVCSNHISASDPVVICDAFKKHQIRFMAKKELFKIPVVSGFLKVLGAFPIDRGGQDVGAIKTAVSYVTEGKCIGIFPQGHRYPAQDPRSTKTKNGAALIATKAGADILPVYVYRKNNTPKLFRKTYVIIGEKIKFEDLCYNSEASGEYARITDTVFDRICSLGESFSPEEYKRAGSERGDKK